MKGRLSFANFTLRFGDKVLLDFVDEIVIPSFFENAYRDAGSSAKYFFLNVSVKKMKFFNEDCTCIIGRIVKNKKHKVTQQFDAAKRELIPTNIEYLSAPSSFFVLVLENHQLIYLPANYWTEVQPYRPTRIRLMTL